MGASTMSPATRTTRHSRTAERPSTWSWKTRPRVRERTWPVRLARRSHALPLREKLIKIGAKVVRHSKYVTFQMADVAVPRELFAAILERIQRFRVPPPLLRRV